MMKTLFGVALLGVALLMPAPSPAQEWLREVGVAQVETGRSGHPPARIEGVEAQAPVCPWPEANGLCVPPAGAGNGPGPGLEEVVYFLDGRLIKGRFPAGAVLRHLGVRR